MKHITAPHMHGFVNGLTKEAINMRSFMDLYRRAAGKTIPGHIGRATSAIKDTAKKHLSGRYGRQVALGAGLGAAGGAATGDDENWKTRALQGALIGGTAAGGRILGTKVGRQAASEATKRFGERQLYTLTGKGFKGREVGLEDAKRLGILKVPEWEKLKDTPGAVSRAVSKVTGKPAKTQLGREAGRYAADVEAFQKGFQNIPGVVHGALTRPGELLRSGWQRAGTAGKVFAGAGALEAARAATKKPEAGDPGRAQAALGSLGRTAGYLVAPGAMLGQVAVGGLAGKGGEAVGKIGDVASKARKAAIQVPYQQYADLAPYYGGR
jgi:hypothetical protein